MMKFMVSYRGKDGKPATACIEAENRNRLLCILESRGISATRIESGANKQTRASRAFSMRVAVWCSVAICLCLAIIGIVLALNKKQLSTTKRTTSSQRIKDVAPVRKTNDSRLVSQTEEAIATHVTTNKDNKEERQLTPEEIEAEERRKDPLYDRHHIVAKMPLVKEPIEQLMLTVFTTELGDMPPMLPAIPAFDEAQFEKLAALHDTQKEEGDNEEVLISKDIVNAVKKELANYLKEGGTTSSFLSYYVNELDKAFHEREMCKSLQMKSMKTDDPEVAREVYLKFNERLSAKGIKPLTLTKRQKEYLGIEE